MKTHIEQHIWTLLEDLGYNPENDSESYNKADKVICNICDLFKRTQPDKKQTCDCCKQKEAITT